MAIETIITSLIASLISVVGPLITTFKIYKNKINLQSYVFIQKITLIFQFLLTALTISAISYQLFVKRTVLYQSNAAVDLAAYSLGLLFTIFNLVYFQNFIIDVNYNSAKTI